MASRLTTFIVATIVVGTVIAGLIVGAQRDDAAGPIDLIITNGRVYTGSSSVFAEAIAVRGNKVLLVGGNREIKRLRRPHTTMIDAHGGSVLAGFNDASVDFLRGGRILAGVDLFGARTLTEVEARVRAFATEHADEPWIRGRGWHYQPLPGALAARQRLDALVPDRPAFVRAHDGRTGWANSRALQLAGITRRTANTADGVIVKDPRTGEPTGVLRGPAMQLVENVMIATRPGELRDAARTAVSEAHRVGVTSMQHLAGGVADLEALSSLRSMGELNVRVYAGLLVAPGLTEAEADAMDRVRAQYPDDPLFKAGAATLRLRSDAAGAFSRRIARAEPVFTPAELDRVVTMLDRRGWQVVVRSADQPGTRMAIDAFERVMAANPDPPRARRHRIEHAGALDDEDVDRLVALGIIASRRPSEGSFGDDVEAWAASRQRDEDLPWPALEKIRAAGGQVVFGSNWPLAALDPLSGLEALRAVATGEDDAEEAQGGASTLPDALDAYTVNGAWSTFDELRKGRLERDMLADIVILTGDIFRPGTQLRDVVVDKTIFDGRVMYTRPVQPETTD